MIICLKQPFFPLTVLTSFYKSIDIALLKDSFSTSEA